MRDTLVQMGARAEPVPVPAARPGAAGCPAAVRLRPARAAGVPLPRSGPPRRLLPLSDPGPPGPGAGGGDHPAPARPRAAGEREPPDPTPGYATGGTAQGVTPGAVPRAQPPAQIPVPTRAV